MNKRIIFAILVTGFSGMVAQLLLIRELLITFYGNELSIGIMLANWLILEAAGCVSIRRKIEHMERRVELFIGLQLIFSLCLPLVIYLARTLKEIIGVTSGESLGLLPISFYSFLILLPIAFTHGALFTFNCKIYSLVSKGGDSQSVNGQSIGKVYVYETVGTIIGGIIFTYLLIPYFHSFNIVFGITLLNFAICILLLGHFWQRRAALSNKILGSISLILFVLYTYTIIGTLADNIHMLSARHQWKQQNVVYYQNSIYGNVAVTERSKQYTFFSNGIPIVVAPIPDIAFVEEFVHLPMLSHKNPKEILIISGGAGGVINEILKHQVERIDYVELDPLLLKVIKQFTTPLTEKELTSYRVNIEYLDGRLFIKRTSNKYDIVMVGLFEPSDLQVNRLFTREFFYLVKNKLKEDGILVVGLPGSLTYLNKELKNLNACILNTLEAVYPYVQVIPGDFNLFLASTSNKITLINHNLLSHRLNGRELKVSLITPPHIEYRLHKRWLNWFLTSIENSTKKINDDFSPIGVFYSLSYWNAMFSPNIREIFNRIERVNLLLFAILLSIFTIPFLIVCLKIKRFAYIGVPLCIGTTGFAGMIFDLALVFTFQVLYGYIFRQIGLLVTTFMVGIAVGGITMTSFLGRIKKDFISFTELEVAIILFSILLPLIFLKFSPHLEQSAVRHINLCAGLFLVMAFFSGILIGAEFPLANKIYLKTSNNLSGTAGLLYGADLFGGWIGGIVGSVVLLPVLGLLKTCIVVIMLKVSSLIILITSTKK
ncbi:MAG: spermine synthase [bacterium]|nr:spermine synthase [bacterium]